MPSTPKQKSTSILIIVSLLVVIVVGIWAGLTKTGYISNFLNLEILCPQSDNQTPSTDPAAVYKPVIYLYPTKKCDVTVSLDYHGQLITDYPKYDPIINGWQVTAYPDGRIIDRADNQEYSYIFWEGLPSKSIDWDLSTGFVIKGKDTVEFLQSTLAKIGLTPKEYNEFIVYWYPQMKDNSYNLIHFADSQYTNTAPLQITPQPDSLLRVFMVYQPLNEKIAIPQQQIEPFARNGFTVIEWGGTKTN